MNAVIPFTFESSEIRVIDVNGEPWFVARDVAAVLGYADTADAVQRHCKKAQRIDSIRVGVSPTLQNQTLIIPESDVNRLIFRSKLPAAERIQDWLAEEVIPAIRKTGSYTLAPMSPAEMLVAQAQMLVDHERRTLFPAYAGMNRPLTDEARVSPPAPAPSSRQGMTPGGF